MTIAQAKFVALEKRKEEIKKYAEDLAAAVAEVQKEVGIDGFFQDTEGTVYQIVIPKGKFVYFEHVSYIRTRRINEKSGDLSITKAEAAGYSVPQK
jgi:hypothetical protein